LARWIYCYMDLWYSQSVTPSVAKHRGEAPISRVRPSGLTVDELARVCGTTTRNVRAFQTLGLLPGPHLQGRRGYYDTAHVDRVRAILRLQREGFSLSAIGALFEASARGETLEAILGISTDSAVTGDVDSMYAFSEWGAPRGHLVVVLPSEMLEEPLAS
jgi:DNA-binding transcriptional MerR regulator